MAHMLSAVASYMCWLAVLTCVLSGMFTLQGCDKDNDDSSDDFFEKNDNDVKAKVIFGMSISKGTIEDYTTPAAHEALKTGLANSLEASQVELRDILVDVTGATERRLQSNPTHSTWCRGVSCGRSSGVTVTYTINIRGPSKDVQASISSVSQAVTAIDTEELRSSLNSALESTGIPAIGADDIEVTEATVEVIATCSADSDCNSMGLSDYVCTQGTCKPSMPMPTAVKNVQVQKCEYPEYNFGTDSYVYFGDVELGTLSTFTVDFDARLNFETGVPTALFAYGNFTKCGLSLSIQNSTNLKWLSVTMVKEIGKSWSKQVDWKDVLPSGFEFKQWHTYRLVKQGRSAKLYIDTTEFDLGANFIGTIPECEAKVSFGSFWHPDGGHNDGSALRRVKIFYNSAQGPLPAPTDPPACPPPEVPTMSPTAPPTERPTDSTPAPTELTVLPTPTPTTLATPPPTDATPTPTVKACPSSGLTKHNRSWYLSCAGDDCATTCSGQGLVFDWYVAPHETPIVPQLLGFEPEAKQNPWGSAECYVTNDDRYHTATYSGAGDASPGEWKESSCRLACPCIQASCQVVHAYTAVGPGMTVAMVSRNKTADGGDKTLDDAAYSPHECADVCDNPSAYGFNFTCSGFTYMVSRLTNHSCDLFTSGTAITNTSNVPTKCVYTKQTPSPTPAMGAMTAAPTPSPTPAMGAMTAVPTPFPTPAMGAMTAAPTPSPTPAMGAMTAVPTPFPTLAMGAMTAAPTPAMGAITVSPTPFPTLAMGAMTVAPTPSPTPAMGAMTAPPTPSPTPGMGAMTVCSRNGCTCTASPTVETWGTGCTVDPESCRPGCNPAWSTWDYTSQWLSGEASYPCYTTETVHTCGQVPTSALGTPTPTGTPTQHPTVGTFPDVPLNTELYPFCSLPEVDRQRYCHFENAGTAQPILHCVAPVATYQPISFENCPTGTENPDSNNCCSPKS